MNKIEPITCTATDNLEINIPDTQGRNIVLYFYPKDATPGCTTEGLDFSANYQSFLDANTLIYGVSRDNLKSHQKFRSKHNFPFELIADETGVLCKLFGVWQLKKFMGREFMGIVRSTFLIDAQGNIVKHWDKVKVKGHVEEVLSAVLAL